jgi:hypothetical protein
VLAESESSKKKKAVQELESKASGGVALSFTQEATIRTYYNKLKNFIRLVDYVMMDAKIDLVVKATGRLAQQIDE